MKNKSKTKEDLSIELEVLKKEYQKLKSVHEKNIIERKDKGMEFAHSKIEPHSHNDVSNCTMDSNDDLEIRKLFDDYIRMYATRDDLLTTYFSENFSGFTGGGDFLVKDKNEWVIITRKDFAQVKDSIQIEHKDLSLQRLSDSIAVVTSFFKIHLPIKDHILSRETARLVLIFRKESGGWKITHSSISIPYNLVREGEVYPLQGLEERNRVLEELILERTIKYTEVIDQLEQKNLELENEIKKRKQAEKIFQDIIDKNPLSIQIVDKEGFMLNGNPAFKELFGVIPPADFSIFDDLQSKSLEIKKLIALVKDGEVVHFPDLYYNPKDVFPDLPDNPIWVRALIFPLFDSYGNPERFIIMHENITERKKADEKLRRSERELKRAQQITQIGSWYLDVATNQVVWTEELYKMYGFDPALPVPPYTEHQKLFTPKSWKLLSSSLANTIDKGIPYELELKTVKDDGSNGWMWVKGETVKDQDGKIIGLWGAAQEITERKRVEEKLQQRESYLTAIIENQPGLVWLKDLQSRFLAVNQSFADSCGKKSPEELFNKTDFDIWPKELAEKYRADDASVIKNKIPVVVEELINEGGVAKWFETFKTPVHDINGVIIGTTGYSRDITGRKQQEEKINNSLQEKEILLKEIHHRVNNNFQIISSLLSLQTEHITDEKVADVFNESQNRIKSMALIHELMYGTENFSNISLEDFICKLINYLKKSYFMSDERININLDIDQIILSLDTLIPIGLIINELVSNSFKHAFPNDRNGEIFVSIKAAEDENYLLSVKDSGIGLPKGFDLQKVNSLGMFLVITLSKQLKGELKFSGAKSGTEAEIIFKK